MISIYKKQNKKIERLECIARVSSLAQNGVADLFELLHNLPKAAVIEYIKKLPKHRSSWLIQFICQNYAAGLVSIKILSFSEPLKRLESDAILTLDAAKTLYQELFADNLAMAQMAQRMVIAGRTTDPARLFFSGHHGLRVKIVAAAGQSLPEQEALAKAHKYLSIYEEKIPAKRHK